MFRQIRQVPLDLSISNRLQANITTARIIRAVSFIERKIFSRKKRKQRKLAIAFKIKQLDTFAPFALFAAEIIIFLVILPVSIGFYIE